VGGGGGGVDGAGVPVFDEVGKVAGVVDVGVAEDDGIDGARVEGEVAVALEGFFARALVEAAFEQDSAAVDLDQVHGAGDGLCRSVKGYVHCCPPFYS